MVYEQTWRIAFFPHLIDQSHRWRCEFGKLPHQALGSFGLMKFMEMLRFTTF
jgi:hypothetical protein